MPDDDPVGISFDMDPPEDLVADRAPVIQDYYDISEVDTQRLAEAVDRGRQEGWKPRKTTRTVYGEVSVPREKVLTIIWNENNSIYTLDRERRDCHEAIPLENDQVVPHRGSTTTDPPSDRNRSSSGMLLPHVRTYCSTLWGNS